MLARSGFGWNETSQMIVVSDEVFKRYVKIDPFAKTSKYKSFPYYPTWTKIFEKDRVTGEYAEDIYNASNNVSNETIPLSPQYYVPSTNPNVFGDDHDFMDSFTQSTAHLNAAPSDTEHISSKKSKKSMSTVDEKIDTFITVTETVLLTLLNALVSRWMNYMAVVRFGVQSKE
ncbi:UNVERIFIED_CONTAM: hypothetical protein Slati_3668800 [Sesamum latifolium]|uniref:Myb/SANT-like domain-containing protein n=1 Tax=Sesamum latifolium TaxID=2727402 RepID=A0AAW2U4Z8_9LAMI